jgi:crotonobetainyl-CoA:carnitine CoA-transferase CaiB-like acyl-CoA transferase
LLRALGVGPDVASVGAAIAERGATAVESDVVACGGVAVAVRDAEQWNEHPQGQAVSDQPLIGAARIDGAGPRRRGTAERPASDLRVLDLTRVIAGPVATRYLAALGADVLRVDPPHRPELALNVCDGLAGKRSAIIDARTPGGLEQLHGLLDGADVVVHGYRPGSLSAFGLDAASLAERHPGIVDVSLSAWGRTGPWGHRRGFDSIVQAACGIAMIESPDGDRPGALPCQLLDHGTGYLAAAAALAGVRRQSSEGGTHSFELSLSATAAWLLGQPRPGATMTSVDPAPEASRRWLATLPSPAGQVTIVTPPGRLGGRPLRRPEHLTAYGEDLPSW